MRKRCANYASFIKNWINDNRSEAVIITVILLIGAFVRLYRIGDYMTFLGDEGRDAIIVRRLLVDFDPILIGPGTSIGNMYLGPLYYYLIAPALLFANFSPVGPSVLVALLGIATIFLVWIITREWFGTQAAHVSSALYALSPTVIIYSKSSWNPNVMPFFALLSLYVVWKVWKFSTDTEKRINESPGWSRWIIVIGISYAFVLQSHYLGLLLSPLISLFWLLAYLNIRNQKKEKRHFLLNTFFGIIIFAGLMSPLVIFDARHGWQNFNAIKKFFLERQTTVSARPWTALPQLPVLITKSVTRLIAGTDLFLGKYLTIALAVLTSWFAVIGYKNLNKIEKKALFFIFVWLTVAYIGLGVYKQEIYDHYYGFFFPAPFIIFGFLFNKVYAKFGQNGKILSVTILLLLLISSITHSPLRGDPNHQMKRASEIAESIKAKSNGEKFNLAVIAERNYEDGYQYFLEKDNAPVYDIDPLKLDETLANQLFVVCELPEDKCDPTHNPKAEVANFGWSVIDDKWKTGGITIFRLKHSQ